MLILASNLQYRSANIHQYLSIYFTPRRKAAKCYIYPISTNIAQQISTSIFQSISRSNQYRRRHSIPISINISSRYILPQAYFNIFHEVYFHLFPSSNIHQYPISRSEYPPISINLFQYISRSIFPLISLIQYPPISPSKYPPVSFNLFHEV